MSPLAILGFLTVIIMLVLIMTKKASPLVALIVVPVVTGIISCFFIAVGLYMMYAGIPTTPFILSFVLGSQMENYFRKAISYGKGDWTLFFTRPVSCILLIVAVGSVFVPLIKEHLAKKKAAAAQ